MKFICCGMLSCFAVAVLIAGADYRPPRAAAQAPAGPPLSPTPAPPAPGPTIGPPPALPAPPVLQRTPDPLSIKIVGPKHPVLGDRPVWLVEVRGDAGKPRWRVSPPTTGLVELSGGMAAEWEPPVSGDFVLYVSVGGANRESADDAINVTVHALTSEPPPQQMPVATPPSPEAPAESRMAAAPRGKSFWNQRVEELVNDVNSTNRVAEARAVGSMVLNLVTRVETSNHSGGEYADDLWRSCRALLGPARAEPWKSFFSGLGRDLTLQDLRHIEQALAHIALAANRGNGSRGDRVEVAKET